MIALVVSTLLTLVVLPGLALYWVTRPPSSLLYWGAKVGAVGVYTLATFYLGGWHMVSYYARFGLLAVFGVVALVGAWRMRGRALWVRPQGWQWIGLGSAVLLLALSTALLTRVYSADQVPPDPVDLTFPLKDGRFYVASGGSTPLMNPHMTVDAPTHRKWRGQRWALDLVELYSSGNRARGLYPTDLDRFAIFGTPVYAPCYGPVDALADTYPDLVPPNRDTTHKAGNYVLLRCATDAYVLLAHLKHGSIVVTEGDTVAAGDLLGEVGNSGNSWEPHLHIHAQRGRGEATVLDADPRPMTFHGRYPVRNDVLSETAGLGQSPM